MTNSVANNGNPFGAADYAKNRNRILETGIDIWEYEGGYSYHGKSILIDDDLSVIGSFNMDMRIQDRGVGGHADDRPAVQSLFQIFQIRGVKHQFIHIENSLSVN